MNVGLPMTICCRQPDWNYLCACRIRLPNAMRDCGRCLKDAPWQYCAHWAIQHPEARFETKSTSHGAQAEEEAQIESSAALDRLLGTITELYDVVDEMGGDLL